MIQKELLCMIDFLETVKYVQGDTFAPGITLAGRVILARVYKKQE